MAGGADSAVPSLLAVALMLGGAWANLFNTLSTTIVFGGVRP